MLPEITECRACGSNALLSFLNLGDQYLSDFRKDDEKPPKYPLEAVFCDNCSLVQLKHTTPQHEMYHDRYGFKSGVSNSIKEDLKDNVEHALKYVPKAETWLDIASNDGTLLSFVPKNILRVGIDPVQFLCDEAKQHADFIFNDYFSVEALPPGSKYDVITSISCFYDMPDPNKFVSDVKKVLAKGGIWDIQQNYLWTTMELSAVDNFCHEHLEYYTLLSLENLLTKHGLEINEVKRSAVNGGSIRTLVSHKGTFPVDRSVELQRLIEGQAKLHEFQPYVRFASRVTIELDNLYSLVKRLKDEGKEVCILAASTRGATIWQSANLDARLISYAVERNPAKVGSNFSAIGVPIISEEEFRERQPDYAIIGPWFFRDEIIAREKDFHDKGGKFIIPLPKVEVV